MVYRCIDQLERVPCLTLREHAEASLAHLSPQILRTSSPQITAGNHDCSPKKPGQGKLPEPGLKASVGFEPTMVDLQSTALATWPRRRHLKPYGSVKMRTVK